MRHRAWGGGMDAFQGFGPGFFGFFRDLSQNNDRDWFQANKARYENDVVTPLMAFITAMQPRLEEVAPYFVAEPKKQGGSMFRIYRDVRFARDKRPYKEHGACQFRHASASRDVHAPGYYVHLAPGDVRFGAGIWLPPSDTLAAIRTRIVRNPDDWASIVGDAALTARFGGIDGEALSRPPKGFSADAPHIDDLKRKTFFVLEGSDERVAGRPDFPDRVAEAFADAGPLMAFLCGAAGVPY